MSGIRYLKPMLNAGSSRVFNCNDVARKLERRDGEENPYLFKTPAMHHLVLVKEALRYDDPRHPKGVAIGSKLYVPYNHDEIYEGGRSIFFHSPNLLQVFHEQFGVERTAVELGVTRPRHEDLPHPRRAAVARRLLDA